MIYILAGLAKSGKSLIAKKVLETKHIQVLSTDWIMMMLYHGNPNLGIDVHKSDISVSRQLEPYLEGLIKALVSSKNDILIEGVHIQPAFANKLMAAFPNRIKAVFLGYKTVHPEQKAKELVKNAPNIDNPWYMNMDEPHLLKLTQYLQNESIKLEQSCQQCHQVYIEIEDVMTQMDDIIDQLFEC